MPAKAPVLATAIQNLNAAGCCRVEGMVVEGLVGCIDCSNNHCVKYVVLCKQHAPANQMIEPHPNQFSALCNINSIAGFDQGLIGCWKKHAEELSAKSAQVSDAGWKDLNLQVTSCRLCSRLVSFRKEVGRYKKPCYRDQAYWSKPLTGMGDRNGRLLVIGLAPAAHGGNRTGRIFTGGPSAAFLMRALWEAGFAHQPESNSRDDNLQLHDVYLTNLVRCTPPANRPDAQETLTCRRHLISELNLLKNLRVAVPLGAFALKGYLAVLREAGMLGAQRLFPFRHGAVYETHGSGPLLVPSYHPSQQNTFTGKLTPDMMRELFLRVQLLIQDA